MDHLKQPSSGLIFDSSSREMWASGHLSPERITSDFLVLVRACLHLYHSTGGISTLLTVPLLMMLCCHVPNTGLQLFYSFANLALGWNILVFVSTKLKTVARFANRKVGEGNISSFPRSSGIDVTGLSSISYYSSPDLFDRHQLIKFIIQITRINNI